MSKKQMHLLFRSQAALTKPKLKTETFANSNIFFISKPLSLTVLPAPQALNTAEINQIQRKNVNH
jgi:hypothetical protein